MLLSDLKLRIWQAAQGNLYTIQVAAASCGASIPIETVEGAEAVLQEVNRMHRIEPGDQDRRVIPIGPPKFQRVAFEVPEWEDIL